MTKVTHRRFLRKINAPGYVLTQRDCERLEEMRQAKLARDSRTKKEELASGR